MNDPLIIAGRTISLISFLDFDQQISRIGGAFAARLANGAADIVSHWSRHRISLSGTGWVPPALIGIDYNNPFSITLPRPIAFAVGEALPSGWTIVRETTVTDQESVVGRLVWVSLTVIAPEGAQGGHNNTASPSWQLVCEEN